MVVRALLDESFRENKLKASKPDGKPFRPCRPLGALWTGHLGAWRRLGYCPLHRNANGIKTGLWLESHTHVLLNANQSPFTQSICTSFFALMIHTTKGWKLVSTESKQDEWGIVFCMLIQSSDSGIFLLHLGPIFSSGGSFSVDPSIVLFHADPTTPLYRQALSSISGGITWLYVESIRLQFHDTPGNSPAPLPMISFHSHTSKYSLFTFLFSLVFGFPAA